MRIFSVIAVIGTVGGGLLAPALAGDKNAAIESAMNAAPPSVSANATIKDHDGKVLRAGNNGWTCYPASPSMGAMCNDAEWDAMIAAMMAKKPYTPTGFGASYMLTGDGEAAGVSNKDPFAAGPTADNDWVKEGPHMMVIVPDPAMLENVSTDPKDPVYVMWKGTPYAHIMVRISE